MLPPLERQPEGARAGNTPFYPMQILNGLVIPKMDRQAPSSDYDETPRLFRRYVDAAAAQQVQIYNGLRNRIASGWRRSQVPGGVGYLNVTLPRIPGQTRGNYGGFVPRGPSPYNVGDLFTFGPGSQPAHPGGPAKIAATSFQNPMTG